MASPANRRRAREAGIDLTHGGGIGTWRTDSARGFGRGRDGGGRWGRQQSRRGGCGDGRGRFRGRGGRGAGAGRVDVAAETSEIKVIGLRRLIAERMSEAKRTIPHFAYVEEVDVTELESLRHH